MDERTLSPKFSRPTANPPRTTVKCNHDKNVLYNSDEIELRRNERRRHLSFAKKTWRERHG